MADYTEHPASPEGPASRLGGVHNDQTQPAQGSARDLQREMGRGDVDEETLPGFAEGQILPSTAAQRRTSEAIAQEITNEALRDQALINAVARRKKERDT